ncbi:MAG: DNA mismatch repair endonuclease MutL [Erysipelotrichaceae bacterium]|jgi:DNA mismatch repair protein MutL|nr:DNA mismatch repair endonuclease MutL [Erysipelotrichaceae bacterium]
MSIIRLDSHLTNMIAAGEVVERPAGIVKELVENSLDAKAKRIDVAIEDGGITSITVSDDGTGMDSVDAAMAFERHATSKISGIEDLWRISTMGFRGEALPSIASVSETELITSNGSECTKVIVDYGEKKVEECEMCPQGTTVKVKGLFLKTPARLKHLRSLNYESGAVAQVVERFALAHPDIAFSLTSNNQQLLQTSGNGSRIDVIFQIYGRSTAKASVEVNGSDYDYTINGVAVLPSINRANRNYITLFVNSRLVRSPSLTSAVAEAYAPYLPPDRYPIAVLDLTMDPQLVDVNVHPSKWEIRLSEHQRLYDLVKSTLQTVLKEKMQAPEMAAVSSEAPLYKPALDLAFEQISIRETESAAMDSGLKQDNPTPFSDDVFPALRLIGQLHGKYILCQAEDGLYIIDQHAAQERYRYELFDQKMSLANQPETELVIPVYLPLTPSQSAYNELLVKRFGEVQLEAEILDNALVVRKVPLWMAKEDVLDFCTKMVDEIISQKSTDLSMLRKRAAATMACHSSIRFNRHLSNEEMQRVLDDLASCKQPYHCPHGRPTFIKISDTQLTREFLR